MRLPHSLANGLVMALQSARLLNPRALASLRYLYKFRRWPCIDRPRDLNEVILSLMFRTDTSQWPRLADKYEVRSYVAERGLESILPQLYGVYGSLDEVDFARLPRRCAVKLTNGCGYVLIYDGDNRPDPVGARRKMSRWLKAGYGYVTAEPHYTHIRPRILVEQLLDNDLPGISPSPVDYKVWCLDGRPEFVMCCSHRDIERHRTHFGYYSLPGWQRCPGRIHPSYANDVDIPRPACLDHMLECAARLAQGHPVARVDMYVSGGRVYFGEMTMSSQGGRMRYFTDDTLLELGRKVDLGRIPYIS